jgi:hypothetical protein
VYEKVGSKADEASFIYFWKLDELRKMWYIGTNYSASVHGIESPALKGNKNRQVEPLWLSV